MSDSEIAFRCFTVHVSLELRSSLFCTDDPVFWNTSIIMYPYYVFFMSCILLPLKVSVRILLFGFSFLCVCVLNYSDILLWIRL